MGLKYRHSGSLSERWLVPGVSGHGPGLAEDQGLQDPKHDVLEEPQRGSRGQSSPTWKRWLLVCSCHLLATIRTAIEKRVPTGSLVPSHKAWFWSWSGFLKAATILTPLDTPLLESMLSYSGPENLVPEPERKEGQADLLPM